jgi:hypothetical protein
MREREVSGEGLCPVVVGVKHRPQGGSGLRGPGLLRTLFVAFDRLFEVR